MNYVTHAIWDQLKIQHVNALYMKIQEMDFELKRKQGQIESLSNLLYLSRDDGISYLLAENDRLKKTIIKMETTHHEKSRI
jgi:hypothetical protein